MAKRKESGSLRPSRETINEEYFLEDDGAKLEIYPHIYLLLSRDYQEKYFGNASQKSKDKYQPVELFEAIERLFTDLKYFHRFAEMGRLSLVLNDEWRTESSKILHLFMLSKRNFVTLLKEFQTKKPDMLPEWLVVEIVAFISYKNASENNRVFGNFIEAVLENGLLSSEKLNSLFNPNKSTYYVEELRSKLSKENLDFLWNFLKKNAW